MTDLSGLADSDLQALAAGDMSKVSAAGLAHLSGGDAAPEAPKRGLLSYATGALDELGGLSRTALAHGVGHLTGTSDQVDSGHDWEDAARGQAPTSAEYMKRAGVGEGAKMSDLLSSRYAEPGMGGLLHPEKGGALDPSVRGTLGLALDIATDPLTYLTMGGSAAGKLGKAGKIADAVAHPVETALSQGGKSIYKSGLKAVDQEAARFGKAPVSDLLFDNGVRGTGRQVADQAADLARGYGSTRDAILASADAKGATVDFGKFLEDPEMLRKIEVMKADPAQRAAGEALENKLLEYSTLGKQTASGASDLKSSLYKLIGTPAYEEAKATPFYKEGLQDIAGKIKSGIEDSAEHSAGLGKDLADNNSAWGQLLTVAKKANKEALKGENKNYLTSVDGIIAGMAHGNPAIIATKKAADLAKTTWLRTNLGYAMNKFAKFGGGDAIQREMVNSQSPWAQMQQEQK